jgi:hypothetical protein
MRFCLFELAEIFLGRERRVSFDSPPEVVGFLTSVGGFVVGVDGFFGPGFSSTGLLQPVIQAKVNSENQMMSAPGLMWISGKFLGF